MKCCVVSALLVVGMAGFDPNWALDHEKYVVRGTIFSWANCSIGTSIGDYVTGAVHKED